jgi:hypothetical protein
MADVFISYKSEDREWAHKIDALIRPAGYTTWWDPSLQTGERYSDRAHKSGKAFFLWRELHPRASKPTETRREESFCVRLVG